MKYKYRKDKDGRGRYLTLESEKDEQLDYVAAERLTRGDLPSFLELTYKKKQKCYTFDYALGAAAPLKDLLKNPLPPGVLQSIFISLYKTLRCCGDEGFSRLRIVFVPDLVFWDHFSRTIRFVYVPITSYKPQADISSMMIYICEQAKLVPEEERLRAAIHDLALRNTIITDMLLEDFLREQNIGVHGGNLVKVNAGHGETDSFDTRASFGWDFVKEIKQESDKAKFVTASAAPSRPQALAEGNKALMLRLTRLDTGARFRMADGVFYVGRDSSCDLRIDDVLGVSRMHAQFKVRNGVFAVRDLGSTNGTIVDGRRLPEGKDCRLEIGSHLFIGPVEFLVG